MSTVRFYSKNELKKLSEIKAIPKGKARKVAIDQFCKENNRPLTGVYAKLLTVRSATKKEQSEPKAVLNNKGEFVIAIKSMTLKNGSLIIHY